MTSDADRRKQRRGMYIRDAAKAHALAEEGAAILELDSPSYDNLLTAAHILSKASKLADHAALCLTIASEDGGREG